MDVKLQTPDLDPMLAKVVRMLRNRTAFVKNWAQSTAKEARANAQAKGGRRYWYELARSIRVRSVSENAADVSSDHTGAAIKQYGGVIKPKNKNALTIPITKEARGKTAAEFALAGRTLFRLPGTRLLGYSEKNGDFKALFVLSKRSVQRPDPWFPSDDRVRRIGAREALLLYNKEQKLWNTR